MASLVPHRPLLADTCQVRLKLEGVKPFGWKKERTEVTVPTLALRRPLVLVGGGGLKAAVRLAGAELDKKSSLRGTEEVPLAFEGAVVHSRLLLLKVEHR